MNSLMGKSPFKPKPGRPYSVFVFNAGGCGGCEIEILSLFPCSAQPDEPGYEFIGQPETADFIVLFGALNQESSQVFKKFLPRFNPDSRRLVVGACGITGGLYQATTLNDLRWNLIKEFSPDLYLAGCPPAPEDIKKGLQSLAEASRPEPVSRLKFSPKLCLGCGLCQQICPGQAIKLSAQPIAADDGQKPAYLLEIDQGSCLFCSLCQQLCPTGCLSFSGPAPLLGIQPEDLMLRGLVPLSRCPVCQKWTITIPEAFAMQLFGSYPEQSRLCPSCRRSLTALKTATAISHRPYSGQGG